MDGSWHRPLTYLLILSVMPALLCFGLGLGGEPWARQAGKLGAACFLVMMMDDESKHFPVCVWVAKLVSVRHKHDVKLGYWIM